MPLLNCYGLSETTGGITVQNANKMSLSAAGFTLPGMEIKIANPDEKWIGEICIKGRAIMNGYYKNANATKEVIDPQGYFHSGDIGRIDEHGFLFITGRIKELIITAGGENIAPVIIEDNFKQACPVASNIMVVGENQRFLAAIITIKSDVDMATGIPNKNLSVEAKNFFKRELGLDLNTTEDAITNEKVNKYIQ